MAVKGSAIENREQDLTMDDRGAPPPDDSAEAQLVRLRQRIRAGMNAVGHDPKQKDAAACQACFQRGWLAAMRSLSKE